MEETFNIKFEKRTRKEWLNEMPEMINKLVKNYNFYYSGGYISTFKGEITDLVTKKYKKNRHKIVLYQNEKMTQVYLVVYSKKTITVYYTNDYDYNSTNNKNRYSSLKRFMKKFCLANEEAVKWNEEQKYLMKS